MDTRWVIIKTKAMARIMFARIARPQKLELGSCEYDLHQAWLSRSSFPDPRWLDKLSAFASITLCEVERIQKSGIVNNSLQFDFVNNYTPTASAVSVWVEMFDLAEFCCKVKLSWIICFFWQQSYLVDPASSHMLVSKIKPCMSKYKQLYTVKLRTAHYISNNLFDGFLLHG